MTLAGFRAWATSDDIPEHVRVTYVDKVIYYDMSNEDPETHVKVKGEVSRGVMNLNRKLKRGTFYPDGVLVTNVLGELSNNPDGIFILWSTFRAGRVRLVPKEGREGRYVEIEGTPDWVMEVLSDNSVRKDKVQLFRAYHRAGISEYWLIDARGADIVFQIFHWHKEDYKPAAAKGGWQVSRVFKRRFRLVRQRDEMGLWEYTLQSRPSTGKKDTGK
jgi:Uma2 family endonuclease